MRRYLIEERAGSLFDDDVRASTIQHFAGNYIDAGGNPLSIIRGQESYARGLNSDAALRTVKRLVLQEYPDLRETDTENVDWVTIRTAVRESFARVAYLTGVWLFAMAVMKMAEAIAEKPEDRLPSGSYSTVTLSIIFVAVSLMIADITYVVVTGQVVDDWTSWAALGAASGLAIFLWLYFTDTSPGPAKWWLVAIGAVSFYCARLTIMRRRNIG